MNGRVVVVGEEIAGLACAREIQDNHKDFLALEV